MSGSRQFPIRAKLFGLAAALLAFVAVLGVLSIHNLGAVNAKGGSMYRDRVVPVRDLGRPAACSATSTARSCARSARRRRAPR